MVERLKDIQTGRIPNLKRVSDRHDEGDGVSAEIRCSTNRRSDEVVIKVGGDGLEGVGALTTQLYRNAWGN